MQTIYVYNYTWTVCMSYVINFCAIYTQYYTFAVLVTNLVTLTRPLCLSRFSNSHLNRPTHQDNAVYKLLQLKHDCYIKM